jgi:hypothetical protein
MSSYGTLDNKAPARIASLTESAPMPDVSWELRIAYPLPRCV